MRFRRKDLSIILIVCILIAFIIPFIFKKDSETIAVLSTSLTAVGAFATVFTAFIAIALYDKFGVDEKLVTKQADKVLELIDLLKGKVFAVSAKIDESNVQFNYFIRLSKNQLVFLKNMPMFKANKNKKIVASYKDYEEGVREILVIKRSYWLPKEIKDKLEFFDIAMLATIDQNDIDKFAFIDMGTKIGGQFGLLYPEMNFNQFVNNIYMLVATIEDWLSTNTSIKIDFKMEELEKFELDKTNGEIQ